MNIFNFLFYRMLTAYKKKRDMPIFNTTLYMFILKFMLLIVFLVLLRTLFGTENFIIRLSLEHSVWFFSILSLGILIFNYFAYFTQDYSKLEDKYEGIAKWVKVWMLVFLPMLILFGGILLVGYIF